MLDLRSVFEERQCQICKLVVDGDLITAKLTAEHFSTNRISVVPTHHFESRCLGEAIHPLFLRLEISMLARPAQDDER